MPVFQGVATWHKNVLLYPASSLFGRNKSGGLLFILIPINQNLPLYEQKCNLRKGKKVLKKNIFQIQKYEMVNCKWK